MLMMLVVSVNIVEATYVEMEKTHDPPKALYYPGEQLQFNITIGVKEKLDGPILAIENLKIIDDLPTGLVFNIGNRTSSPQAINFKKFENGTLIWDFGPGPFTSLPQATIRFNVTITEDVQENVFLQNSATASYTESSTGVPSNPSVTEAIHVVYPIIEIVKTCNEYIHEGDEIYYTITATNTGHENAENVTIVDTLPTGVSYNPGSATATTGVLNMTAPGVITWKGDIDKVTGNNTVIINIPVTDNSDTLIDEHINTVSIYEYPPYSKIIQGTDNCTTYVIRPSIDLTKTPIPSLIHEGDNVSYTFTTQNTGNTPLYNVTIYDLTWSTQITGPMTLMPGQIVTFNNSKTLTSTITNTAISSGIDLLGMMVNDTAEATVTVITPEIMLTKNVNQSIIYMGDTVAYTFNSTNIGDTDLYNVTLFDETLMIQTVLYMLGPGESHIYTLTTFLLANTTNTANVSGVDVLGRIVSDTDEAVVRVINPGISLNKTVDKTHVLNGEEVNYTYTVMNTGDSMLTDVMVYDETLDVLVVGPVSLGPGETLTDYLVANIFTETINTANVSGIDLIGNIWVSKDTAHVIVINPEIELVKTPDKPIVHAGENVTYYYTVTNINGATLFNVTVYDETLGVQVLGPVNLVSGESMQANITVTIFDDTINTATATGYDSIGNKMTDTAMAEVKIVSPNLELIKTVCLIGLYEPADILYTFTVVNTGDSMLKDVMVYDETLDTLILGPIDLGPGEYAEDTMLIKNVSNGTYINVANATGIDVLGSIVEARAQTSTVIRESNQVPDDEPRFCNFEQLISFNEDDIVVFPTSASEKALNCSPATASDWISSAYVTSRMMDYTEALDTDDVYVNQTSGMPIASDGAGIVTFGGPMVNPVVKYYETVPSTQAPMIRFANNVTHYMFTNNGSLVVGSVLPIEAINNNTDMFLIEIFRDQDNRTVMLLYGYGWKGTYAAGKYFDRVIAENLSFCQRSWMIVKWSDTNNDGFVNMPNDGDTYTLIGSD